MRSIRSIFMALLAIAMFSLCSCDKKPVNMRLLYWNIQNGMWDGQNDNYDRFVEFVKAQDPDICVWRRAAISTAPIV